MRRLLEEQDLELARIPRIFWGSSLASCTIEARTRFEHYVGGLDVVMAAGYGLYLWGANGTGKSCAIAAILKEVLRHGHHGLWLTAQQAVDSRLGREEFSPGTSLSRRALDVDVLVLDDLGKEHRDEKGWVIRMLEQLVRERISAGRILLLTSNMAPGKLAEWYKPSFVECMKGKVVSIECAGPDRREISRREVVEFLGWAG